ncbi:interleukin-17 receptor B isoform X2 [Anarrhichthys ocellatus]|uniref:interleukin-17 receptor B isoform X2 n=1 Tax=Anarrhichthys ocellatus TaxID=433405 RepID=UPI0012ED7809|nr:interleukin-17 receptor B isoform X2 [Anarrhichthys ocellatus]
MMWGAGLILLYYLAAQVTSHEIKVECHESDDFPPGNDTSPSFLVDLRVAKVTEGEKCMMNISWAINIDASIKYLTGIWIRIMGESAYHCIYNPALAKTDLSGSKQKWFYYLVDARYGPNTIEAANLPLPPWGGGLAYKFVKIKIPHPPKRVTPKPTAVPIYFTTEKLKDAVPVNVHFTSIATAIFGGLVSLVILLSCYMIYQRFGANVATLSDFKRLPTSPMAPVPVLVVYPAEDSAFQRAVVALVEFLQWYGGCSVAVDMWQQRKIAEMGPMRWLAEKAKTAHRVLIVCPKSSSLLSHSPPNRTSQEPSIPASAHDLYPLTLNMVAGHAKSASDLAKFCVVQLGEQQDKKPSNLPLELRACKTFYLMKDLNKLCRSLHTGSQDDKKISDLIFRPGIADSENCTVNLGEAVEKLRGHQPNISRKAEPLKSVATII